MRKMDLKCEFVGVSLSFKRIAILQSSEESLINIIICLFDIWISELVEEIVKLHCVFRWNLDTCQNFSEV